MKRTCIHTVSKSFVCECCEKKIDPTSPIILRDVTLVCSSASLSWPFLTILGHSCYVLKRQIPFYGSVSMSYIVSVPINNSTETGNWSNEDNTQHLPNKMQPLQPNPTPELSTYSRRSFAPLIIKYITPLSHKYEKSSFVIRISVGCQKMSSQRPRILSFWFID